MYELVEILVLTSMMDLVLDWPSRCLLNNTPMIVTPGIS